MKTSLLIVCGLLLLAGCAAFHSNAEYLRHRNSQLSEPSGGGDYLWFDVTVSPEYPADSSTAEEQRMVWLQAWLKQRKFCPAGYEILERRKFDFLEDNPAHYDLRYKVQCKTPPPVTE